MLHWKKVPKARLEGSVWEGNSVGANETLSEHCDDIMSLFFEDPNAKKEKPKRCVASPKIDAAINGQGHTCTNRCMTEGVQRISA